MNWETLMCLGDSITIGARSYGGYPDYAGSFLEKSLGNNWNVVNHAVSGFTAMDLARSITADFSNLKQFFPGIITVLIGTNDVKINTCAEDFEIAFRQVVLKAMLIAPNKNVILIKIPSFPKAVSYPYNYFMNSMIDKYNEIISATSREKNLRSLEFRFDNIDLFDGVHLSAIGSRNAGKQLAAFIEGEKGLFDSSSEILSVFKTANA